MPLTINLRHLEHSDLALKGELPAADLELDEVDELIHAPNPLHYELDVQRLEENLLVQGTLSLTAEFECARCLKPFSRKLEFDDWAVHLPLTGDDRVEIVGDCVDLTPHIREDILGKVVACKSIIPARETSDTNVVHREKHQVNANERQPEVHITKFLVHHPAKHLRKPVIHARQQSESRSSTHY